MAKQTTKHTAAKAARPPDRAADPALVAVAAYYRAEKRGFMQGSELDDWLAAEREIREQVSHPA